MKTETRQIYVSDDGKVFDTVEACQAHERDEAAKARRLANLKVYTVSHGFDATEGRGYGAMTYIITDADMPVLIQYCLDRYGRPLSSWYGDGFHEVWFLSQRDSYSAADAIKRAKEPHAGIGSTSARVDIVFLSDKPIDHPDLPARVFPWPRKKVTQ
ncbi:hypothetical protein [Rhizobium sp. 60-20]|uniref:hypothetical protein n=1 Tax=Rhizobium sp. 60-20 TaxID=1895819 RepID=UPI00092BAAD2|nr:hypothetical protein [Rhizobium sp. 60-20]OJY66397.1 MAG: hypothetical protein BGP09_31190 [Rhizobium sp. 60-20]